MIDGVVNSAHEAVVSLLVQGPTGQTLRLDAVIDTGFSRFITLPPEAATELGLALTGRNRVSLADGSEATLDVYGVTVLWDGQPRDVVAYAAGTVPLIGMSILEDHSLYVHVTDGGRVAIQAGG